MRLTVEKIASKLGRTIDLSNVEELDLVSMQIDEVGSFAKCLCLKRLDLRFVEWLFFSLLFDNLLQVEIVFV